MSELSPDAKSLVEAGRHTDAPSAEDKARIKKRLVAELGLGAFAAAAVGTGLSEVVQPAVQAGGRLAGGGLRGGALKLWAGAGAALTVAVGGVWLGAQPSHESARARRTPPAPAKVWVEPVEASPRELAPSAASAPPSPKPAAAAVEAEAPRPAAHGRRRTQPHAAATKPADSDTLSAEVTLLARAQRALRERAPAEALQIVAEHSASFPRGKLQEERAGIEALAHCMLGQTTHPSIARFLADAKRSPVAARVRKECGLP